MHSAKKLTAVLHELLVLLDDEASRNPEFARRLEQITDAIPSQPEGPARKQRATGRKAVAPDIIGALQEKGEIEFRYWLRTLDLDVLKAIVKANGFDPGKIARNWTEPDKFISLICDQAAARLRRGAAFLPPTKAPGEPGER